jgi:metal-responsive CopG/Arc/MetJ family transcriptional regulator
MPKTKVAVTLDAKLVRDVDRLVRSRQFSNRSAAIETALAEKLTRLDRARLARECAKLDPQEERALAEEGLAADFAEWPAY